MAVSERKIKDVMQVIEASITPFMYHDEINVRADDAKAFDRNEVLYNYNTKAFTDSDLQLVKILASQVFSTLTQLSSAVKYETNKRPYLKNMITIEQDNIKSRLGKLCKSGIVQKYKYLPYKKALEGSTTPASYYFVTPHGYNYIKRILHFDRPYDEYLGAYPVEEVFKYLSANTVLCAMFQSQKMLSFENFKRVYWQSEKKVIPIYSQAETEVDGIKNEILFEPLKFKFNEQRLHRDEMKEFLNKRIQFLAEYLDEVEADINRYLVFLAEDISGIKIAANLIADSPLIDLSNQVFITTDAAAHMVGDVSSILLTLQRSEGKLGLKSVQAPFL